MGDELAVLALHGGGVLLEPPRHLVHRVRELAHLVAARDRHASGEVAFSDALGGVQQLAHGLHQAARQHQARRERAHERECAGDEQQLARAAQGGYFRVES